MMLERARFWSHAPLLPLAAVQGRLARRRIPTLPEATGPRTTTLAGAGAPFRLVVLGESTAVGVGVAQQEDGLAFGLARSMAATRGVELRIVGESGANLRRVRALAASIAAPADAVVVATGVNDVLELTRGAVWSHELRALIADLRPHARTIVFSGIPPLGSFRSLPQPTRSMIGARAAYLDARLRAECAAEGVCYAAVSFPARAALLSEDGFHPSAEGYAMWAAMLAPMLAP